MKLAVQYFVVVLIVDILCLVVTLVYSGFGT